MLFIRSCRSSLKFVTSQCAFILLLLDQKIDQNKVGILNRLKEIVSDKGKKIKVLRLQVADLEMRFQEREARRPVTSGHSSGMDIIAQSPNHTANA